MRTALTFVLMLMVACALVVWGIDNARLETALAEKVQRAWRAETLLDDAHMQELHFEFADCIINDSEWIRAQMPDAVEGYYDMCLALEYIADDEENPAWQCPETTFLRGGGDCEDLTTFQLGFGLGWESHHWTMGFIVMYPEVIVEGGKCQGHVAAVYRLTENGKIYVWDLALQGAVGPMELEEYLQGTSVAEESCDCASKFYRIWWMMEIDLAMQPEMELMPL